MEEGFEPTFMSSTKEGKPPIAMKVRKAAVNMSMDPLACNMYEGMTMRL